MDPQASQGRGTITNAIVSYLGKSIIPRQPTTSSTCQLARQVSRSSLLFCSPGASRRPPVLSSRDAGLSGSSAVFPVDILLLGPRTSLPRCDEARHNHAHNHTDIPTRQQTYLHAYLPDTPLRGYLSRREGILVFPVPTNPRTWSTKGQGRLRLLFGVERGHHENGNLTDVFGYQELTLFGLRVHVVIVEITDITWGPPWSLGVVGSGHTRRGIVASPY